MKSALYLDTDLLLLLASDRPEKESALRFVESGLMGEGSFYTSVQNLMELEENFRRMAPSLSVRSYWEILEPLFEEVLGVEFPEIRRAASLAEQNDLLFRDALVLAVMQKKGIKKLLSLHNRLQGMAGLHWLDPLGT